MPPRACVLCVRAHVRRAWCTQARYWVLRYLCAFMGSFPGLEHLASWLLITLFSLIPTMPVAQLGCPYKRMARREKDPGQDAAGDAGAQSSVRSIQLRVALMMVVLTAYVWAVVVASAAVLCLVGYFALAPLLCHCIGMATATGMGAGISAGANTTSGVAASVCGCVHSYYY